MRNRRGANILAMEKLAQLRIATVEVLKVLQERSFPRIDEVRGLFNTCVCLIGLSHIHFSLHTNVRTFGKQRTCLQVLWSKQRVRMSDRRRLRKHHLLHVCVWALRALIIQGNRA